MFRIAMGHAEGVDTVYAAQAALDLLTEKLQGQAPAALLVFAGVEFDHGALISAIGRAYPGAPLAGCTTAGGFSSSIGLSDDFVAILAFVSDTVQFASAVCREGGENPDERANEAWKQACERLGETPKVCLVFPEGYGEPAGRLLRPLNELVPEGCVFFGAQAGADPYDVKQPVLFHESGPVRGGAVIMLMGGPVATWTTSSQSWKPLGPKAEVTDSDGPVIKTVEGRPALEYYRSFLGPHAAPMVEFPLAVYEEGFDDPFVRGPVAHDEEAGTIRVTGDVPVGSHIRITEANPQMLLESVHNVFRETPHEVVERAAVALAVSCSARRSLLGSRAARELATMRHAIPCSMPVFGCFSFGEVGPLRNGAPSFLHNHTLLALFLYEEQAEPECRDEESQAAPRVECAPTESPRSPECIEHENKLLTRKLRRAFKHMERLEDHRSASMELTLKMQEDLRKSEEKYRRIVETSAEGFLLMGMDLEVAYVNDSWLRMTGFAREDILGAHPGELISDKHAACLGLTLDENSPGYCRTEATLPRKDGGETPVLVHANRLTGDGGELLGYFAFFTDLTEQKKALRLAGEFQRSLLPAMAPDVPGMELAGRSEPCDEVGGDYFDYLMHGTGSFGMVVADVSGHGVDASLLMSAVRAYLRSHDATGDDLGEVISNLNAQLAHDLDSSGRFVTLFHLLANLDTGALTWVRAGHDPAWVFDPATEKFSELVGEGLPLGVLEETIYETNLAEKLSPGTLVILATDGIWEARNEAGEMFGKTRFRDVIRTHAHAPTATIRDEVFAAVETFTGGARIMDDLTIVVARFKG